MGGIKSFFKKIGRGFKKAGRWIKDKALPAIGRVVKPILNVVGLLPGKIGMIGKIGGAVTNLLHEGVNNIPNKDVRDKINGAIARGNEKFQGVIDKGKDLAEGTNRAIGVGKEIINTVKDGAQNLVKPAVPPKVIRPM